MKKESSHLKYQDVNNLYGLVISQRLPVNDLKLVEDISEFNKSFIKYYNEESDESYFLEVYFQYTEKLLDLYNDLQKQELVLKRVRRVIKFNQK